MKPFVSVIVPVYNTEKYLAHCIESIQKQTYPNMEIILVNDGSTDGSGKICDDYSQRDRRIQVIHQSNGGIIAAKKAGIAQCHGEYIMFVDSDDWIEEPLLETLVVQMLESNCPLVCSNVFMDKSDGTIERRNGIPGGIYETDKICRDLFFYRDTDQYGILPYSVAKLFPKKMLQEVMAEIGNDIRYAEDKAIVFGCVFKNIKVCFTDAVYYHYCLRQDGTSNMENPDFLIELTAFYKYARKLFESHRESEFLLRQLGRYLLEEAKCTVNYRLGLIDRGKSLYKVSYELDPSVFQMNEKRLIIYGAGQVGSDYYRKLADCMNFCLCGWVDKNYEKCREDGLDVQPVESVRNSEYDYILVAVNRESVFGEIKEELKDIGVMEDKIIWGKPLRTLKY
ncbi:MAG: glycosyltransferase family 2 protein [Roseburia sp.]|nr:glycosyltransferase family 2 protein [Roseburia sp.]MCM1201641.1 glycosyltransferase family 2 protein [Bacteroides fragilis]